MAKPGDSYQKLRKSSKKQRGQNEAGQQTMVRVKGAQGPKGRTNWPQMEQFEQ